MKRSAPTIQAGSMADIAFLLLIFFLVTTTLSNDKGIVRGLPQPCPPGSDCNVKVEEQNLFEIAINEAGELSLNDVKATYDTIESSLITFIDNNGDGSCDYCSGTQDKDLSDTPLKASISIKLHPNASYKHYITVQNEITSAYLSLRKKYIAKKFNKTEDKLTEAELQFAKEAYPFRIVENEL